MFAIVTKTEAGRLFLNTQLAWVADVADAATFVTRAAAQRELDSASLTGRATVEAIKAAPVVTVTLRPDYLARYVDIRIGKGLKRRTWEVQAGDGRGFFTVDVRIDGEPAPKFKTLREGGAWLGTMRVHGMQTARIWAEPRGRVPAAYVSPSQGGGYAVQGALA